MNSLALVQFQDVPAESGGGETEARKRAISLNQFFILFNYQSFLLRSREESEKRPSSVHQSVPMSSYLKYSEAAEAKRPVALVALSTSSVAFDRVLLAPPIAVASVVFAIWSNCRHATEFQGLSHEIQGNVLVNDAKKNLRHHAIITL